MNDQQSVPTPPFYGRFFLMLLFLDCKQLLPNFYADEHEHDVSRQKIPVFLLIFCLINDLAFALSKFSYLSEYSFIIISLCLFYHVCYINTVKFLNRNHYVLQIVIITIK